MWKFVENCCYQRIAPFGVRKISPVWESSETDPAKVCDFGENNSSYQKFFGSFSKRGTQRKMRTSSKDHFTWSCGIRNVFQLDLENRHATKRLSASPLSGGARGSRSFFLKKPPQIQKSILKWSQLSEGIFGRFQEFSQILMGAGWLMSP